MGFIIRCFFSIEDAFGIDEVTMYKGEWKDTDYSVAGDIIDGVRMHNVSR